MRSVNPHARNPCPTCQGWGFFMTSRDPDRDVDCIDCDHGERREQEKERMDSTGLAHIDDPAVSHDAAINLNPTATEKIMHVVVDLLAEVGPQTPAELENLYRSRRMVNGWPQVAFYSIHKRVSQMKKHIGVLQGTGVRAGGAERLELTCEPLSAHGRITAHMDSRKR